MKRYALVALLLSPVIISGEATAATKQKLTDAEKKAMYQEAVKACRKEWGARYDSVEVNYDAGKYYCNYTQD
ncbi:MAG: hypothetical protein KGO94_10355 [Alphaproteobacteria bacterium]|nr:hypothetical protein [Alphaproteobacteria bacterium]